MIAGYSCRDITPPPGLEMCGYGYYLGRVANEVHDNLFARGLYLENSGGKFLLISSDLEGISVDTCNTIKQVIESATGLKPEQVMIHCTHTHSGPACARTRGCGKIDPDYIAGLPEALREVAVDAVKCAAEVDSVSAGSSQAPGLAFNRVYGDKGPMDETVRVLVIRTKEDKPYVIVNYACHPVCSGTNSEISADYPGWVVKSLGESGYKALYVTGFCGDIDPPRNRGYELAEKTGKGVAKVALEAIEGAEKLENCEIRSEVSVIKARKQGATPEELMDHIRDARDILEETPSDGHALCYLSWALDSLDSGECKDIDAPLHVAAVGDVVFAGFPGETFTAFGVKLREQYPNTLLMTVNEADGVIGYIPTADEFDNNGYSVIDSCRIYGEYMFARGFGEDISAAVSGLISSVIKQ